jgi:hypothetical protein
MPTSHGGNARGSGSSRRAVVRFVDRLKLLEAQRLGLSPFFSEGQQAIAPGGSSIAAVELSSAACDAIDEFGKLPSVRVYEQRRGAHGCCHLASAAFALWLPVARVEARITRGFVPRSLDNLAQDAHYAVLVEETFVVDFTFQRQFNSDHPHPRIDRLAVYAEDFNDWTSDGAQRRRTSVKRRAGIRTGRFCVVPEA